MGLNKYSEKCYRLDIEYGVVNQYLQCTKCLATILYD